MRYPKHLQVGKTFFQSTSRCSDIKMNINGKVMVMIMMMMMRRRRRAMTIRFIAPKSNGISLV